MRIQPPQSVLDAQSARCWAAKKNYDIQLQVINSHPSIKAYDLLTKYRNEWQKETEAYDRLTYQSNKKYER